MKKNQIVIQLNELASSLGASELGFSDLSIIEEEKRYGYDNAITVVVRLADGVIEQIKNEPTQTYFAHYRAVNRLIDSITLRLALFLETQGYKAIPIPASQSVNEHGIAAKNYTGVFQHKTGAVLAGLGWIGKSALFVHHRYGPRVRLGTVLTNAPLPSGVPEKESQCGSCRACVKICPAMAIEGKNWMMGTQRNELYDAHACSMFMKEAYMHIGRGAVCGLCMVVCPVGKEASDFPVNDE